LRGNRCRRLAKDWESNRKRLFLRLAQSASCSENSAIRPEVSGRTLRQNGTHCICSVATPHSHVRTGGYEPKLSRLHDQSNWRDHRTCQNTALGRTARKRARLRPNARTPATRSRSIALSAKGTRGL
jgi:hypothetical protein